MLYHYIASNKNGAMIEGDYDAETLAQLLQYLASKELHPVSAKPIKEKGGVRRIFGGINLTDKVFLTKYLSLMLKVGTDLLSAINILINDFDKQAMRNFLLEVRDNLSKGRPFYQAFESYPRIFSTVFVNLVKAAESSGNLQQTFESLSVSMQHEADLRNRIRSAILYPIILLFTSVAIVTFLVVFALPRIAGVFSDSGISPPTFSRVVFGIGLFFGKHVLLIMGSMTAIVAFAAYFFWKNEVGRHMRDGIIKRFPVVKKIYRDIAVQRFASTFSALLKAGIPIVSATKLTADVVGVEEFKDALTRIADQGLSKGLTIGESFRREKVFPNVVTNLVAISEKAGHIEDVLETLAIFYESNIDANVRSLVSFLEPMLLLLMGGIVAIIALAMIIPIYQLTTQF